MVKDESAAGPWTLFDDLHWCMHVTAYSFLILLTCWNIGGVVQVWETLDSLYGRRQVDTGFMSAIIVGLVVALAVFCHKWFMFIVNRNVNPWETRLKFHPMLPFASLVARMKRPILLGLPLWILVLIVNISFHYAAFAWWEELMRGIDPAAPTTLTFGMARANALLLWMFYLVHLIITAYQLGVAYLVGYERLWSIPIYFA
ncbi:hypothetical protein QBC34DRAFT_441268 [Podospora aff. communis PSN243]|uniref:Uncharacterized protein n=1 Tax=Podospora aff. communis PSN243 TaxID=3040156 RepID=A0AAV9GEP1_9PEZI|nr:hypothetical protein QBC34DRAFT_441268 [Podospora aff. communis PSN243]